MTNYQKTISIFQSFSSKEQKSVFKFIEIKYPNSKFLSLFQFLHKNKLNPTETEIFHRLYPDEKYNNLRIKKLLSRTVLILEQFLSTQTISEDIKNQNLIHSLESKHLNTWKSNIIKDLKAKSKPFENYFYFDLVHLEAQDISKSITARGVRTDEPKLQDSHNSLDDYYLIQKLKLCCSALNYSNINNYEYELGIITYLEPYLKVKITNQKPLLYLFYQLYLVVRDRDEVAFKSIIKYLQSNFISRSEDYFEIFTMLINFCIQKINTGNREYIRTLFEVYKFQISSKNIYDNQNLIDVNGYKNIVNLALNLREYDWTEQFIETEKNQLPKLHQEEHYQFVKARLFFELEKYKECIKLIMISKPQDLLNNLSLRILLCKAHFENDEWDMVESNIQNTKIFLLRHKSKAYQLQIYKNFFKLLNSIIHSKQTKADIERLNKLITETNPAAEKAWLMDKVREIL